MGNSTESCKYYCLHNYENHLNKNKDSVFSKSYQPQILQITQQDLLFKSFALPSHYSRISCNVHNYPYPIFYSSLTNKTLQRTQVKVDIKKYARVLFKNFVYGVSYSDAIVTPIFIQLNHHKVPTSVYLYTQITQSTIKEIKAFQNIQKAFKALIQALKGIQIFYNIFLSNQIAQQDIVITKFGKIKIKSQNLSKLMTVGIQNIFQKQQRNIQKQYQVVKKVIKIFDYKINFENLRKNHIFQNFLFTSKSSKNQIDSNITIKQAINILIHSKEYFINLSNATQAQAYESTKLKKLSLKKSLCQTVLLSDTIERLDQNQNSCICYKNCLLQNENKIKGSNIQSYSLIQQINVVKKDEINNKSFFQRREDAKQNQHKSSIKNISLSNTTDQINKNCEKKYQKIISLNNDSKRQIHYRVQSEIVPKESLCFNKQQEIYHYPSNIQLFSPHVKNSKSQQSLFHMQNVFIHNFNEKSKATNQQSTAYSSFINQNKSSFFKIEQINHKYNQLHKISSFAELNQKILKRNNSQLAYTIKQKNQVSFQSYFESSSITQQDFQLKLQQENTNKNQIEKIDRIKIKQNNENDKKQFSNHKSQKSNKNQRKSNNLKRNQSFDSLKLKITHEIIPIDQTKRQYDAEDNTQHQIQFSNNQIQIESVDTVQSKNINYINFAALNNSLKKNTVLKRNSSQAVKTIKRKQHLRNLTYNTHVRVFQYDEKLSSQKSNINQFSNFNQSNNSTTLIDLNQERNKNMKELSQEQQQELASKLIKKVSSFHQDKIKQKVQRLSIARGISQQYLNIKNLNGVLTTKSIKAQKSESEISFVVEKYELY